MASQKKISDYVTVLKPAFEDAIVIDSSDEEEDFIEDTETLQTILDCQPASSHENGPHIDNVSECATDQSNCGSD